MKFPSASGTPWVGLGGKLKWFPLNFGYCNRTNFRTQFNFVYFVLLAQSTKFSSIRKPYTYTSVSDTSVAVRKFLAYESRQTLEYEIFTCTKISAITVARIYQKPAWSHFISGPPSRGFFLENCHDVVRPYISVTGYWEQVVWDKSQRALLKGPSSAVRFCSSPVALVN